MTGSLSKYCAYPGVIYIIGIQSNEVGGSSKMDLNGLKRAIFDIEQHEIEFEKLVTDRHSGVKNSCVRSIQRRNIVSMHSMLQNVSQ